VTVPQPQTLAALCDDILRARPGPGEAATPIFYELIRELKRHAREGRFDMTACLRCGQPKPGDGDEWCRRCEDENAAEVVAAMDGLFDGPD
jgi:ribosomal protein L40E